MVFRKGKGVKDRDCAKPCLHADRKHLFTLTNCLRSDDHNNGCDKVENQKSTMVYCKAHRKEDRQNSCSKKGRSRREKNADKKCCKGGYYWIANGLDNIGCA